MTLIVPASELGAMPAMPATSPAVAAGEGAREAYSGGSAD
jgi:hypothetical protein